MVSSSVSEIFDRLREGKTPPTDLGPVVSVNKLTARAGAFYEKVRYFVDYKDEHTIRRSAIERILKRKLSFEGEKNIGMSLLHELVSAEYLPNHRVPTVSAARIQNIVEKYRLLAAKLEQSGGGARVPKKIDTSIPLSKIEGEIIGLAASEIDRMLFSHEIDDTVVESFYKTLKGKIQCVPPLPEERFRAPLYIACRRTLLRDDFPTLLYVLVSKYVPELTDVDNIEEIKILSGSFAEALAQARRELQDPLAFRIAGRIQNRALGFSVIWEIIKKHGLDAEDIFADTELLESETKKILAEKYLQHNHSLWASGVHAALYILFTKSIFAFLLEVPYEWYLYGTLDSFALFINIIFHPLLLLAIVYTVRPLVPKDMAYVVAVVKDAVKDRGREEVVYVAHSPKKGALKIILGTLYLVLFVGVFGTIVRILTLLHFNPISIVFFLFFLTLVSYFGLRIRHNAKRWRISSHTENTWSLLWNFFTLPFTHAGRWLSLKFASLNVFVFVLDFIIEAPFKVMLGTFDSFLSFLKEKEEDAMY